MPTVTVRFTALPAHVRTARIVAVAVARRCGIDDDVVDEIRLAVGEACGRAVAINSSYDEPVVMTITDSPGEFEVEVADCGTEAADDLESVDVAALLGDVTPPELGLAIIRGLVPDSDVSSDIGGTRVSLRWPVLMPSQL